MKSVKNSKTIAMFNYAQLIDILEQNTPCVLATVIQTMGSTPQKSGSWALIGVNQLLAGTVGGGITEKRVIEQAQALMDSKKSQLAIFSLGGVLDKGSDAICGGRMTIMLDAAPQAHLPVFRHLADSFEKREQGILITIAEYSFPDDVVIKRFWVLQNDLSQLSENIKKELSPLVDKMLLKSKKDSCQLVELQDLDIGVHQLALLEVILPQPSLVIAGAGHIGQSLAQLGKFLGFHVTVWDDRPEYADSEKIPAADNVFSGSCDSFLEQLSIQNNTYLVLVTRGHRSDAELLQKIIGSPAAYIGMIGSKAKVRQMKSSFLEKGLATSKQWKRIYTPIGLDIRAQTIEEIALSIAAQLVKVRNKKYKKGE